MKRARMLDIPEHAKKISRSEFNWRAKRKQFKEGPFIVPDHPETTYSHVRTCRVWGMLKDNSVVWADHK